MVRRNLVSAAVGAAVVLLPKESFAAGGFRCCCAADVDAHCWQEMSCYLGHLQRGIYSAVGYLEQAALVFSSLRRWSLGMKRTSRFQRTRLQGSAVACAKVKRVYEVKRHPDVCR